ncbi:Crp/Fnr family transcriptional regulator [Schlesneria paludicola]|uniref:Crp/Fnr family transcriptional regulator n=1 Tax=Schlesneria paludicola TaxID=360056 RepID=UPI000299F294|nr:Crp/Fnr family transcriptional regulator [Schlesneria paludicola]
MSLFNTISDCDFLRGMPQALLERLVQIAQPCTYAPGTILFLEGRQHALFHVITAGHVRLDMLVPRRGKIPILTVGAGDVLAWSALIGNGTMTATAVALEPVQTIAFAGDQLKQLCETEHEIGYFVMRQLSSALSRRLVATRLQQLDLFAEDFPMSDVPSPLSRSGDLQC